LNVLHFGLIQEAVVKRTRDKLIPVSIVVVTGLAWISISNHCALGALIEAKTQAGMVRMHCHSNQPLPPKKSGDEEMPCCKVLRATLASQGKIVHVATKDFLPIQSWIVAELIFATHAQFPLARQELDTGPPFAGSFAELILQRSLLAHAPPFIV
jgi:hypothetical protein